MGVGFVGGFGTGWDCCGGKRSVILWFSVEDNLSNITTEYLQN